MTVNFPSLTTSIDKYWYTHAVQSIEDRYVDLVSVCSPKPGSNEKNNHHEQRREDSTSICIESIRELDWCHADYFQAHPVKTFELIKYVQTVRRGGGRVVGGMRISFSTAFSNNSWGKWTRNFGFLYTSPSPLQLPESLKQVSSGKCYDFNFKGSCRKFPSSYEHMLAL